MTKPHLKAAWFQDSDGNAQFPTVVFIIETIDNIIIIFFTFEFVVRLLVCPNKMRSKIERTSKIPKGYYPGLKAHFPLGKSGLWGHFPARGDIFRFLKESMNLIDLVAICPFYISLILEVADFIFMDMVDHKNKNQSIFITLWSWHVSHDHTKQQNTQISLLCIIEIKYKFSKHLNFFLEGLEDFAIIGKTGKIIRLVNKSFKKYSWWTNTLKNTLGEQILRKILLGEQKLLQILLLLTIY